MPVSTASDNRHNQVYAGWWEKGFLRQKIYLTALELEILTPWKLMLSMFIPIKVYIDGSFENIVRSSLCKVDWSELDWTELYRNDYKMV